MLAYGSNAPQRLRDSFVRSNFNIQSLIVDTLTLSALHGLPGIRKQDKITP